jgi:hypothetical protein
MNAQEGLDGPLTYDYAVLMVEMTEEQFEAIYEALELANNGYTNEDVPRLVALEGKAWTIVQEVKQDQT